MRARREVRVETLLPAPPEAVFRLLSDHEGMPRWMPVREVVRRRDGAPEPDGRGAIRTIKAGGLSFDEEILESRPGERLEYRVLSGAPLREHRGVVTLSAEGAGTRLVWTVGFRPWLPGTGFLVERAVRRLLEGGVRGLGRLLAEAEPG